MREEEDNRTPERLAVFFAAQHGGFDCSQLRRPAARVADDDAAPAPADRNTHRMEDHPACLAPALVVAAQRAAAGARARPRRDRNDRDTTILLPDTIVVSRDKSRAAGAWFLCAGGAPDSRAARLADVVAAVLEAPAARSTVLAADGAGGLAAATARRPRAVSYTHLTLPTKA